MKIADVEGIGAAHAEKLSAAGVSTDHDLLTHGGSRAGRHRLAAETGIREQVILGWVNRVELLRLDGLGVEHLNLLAAAGVDSATELARRNPDQLAETLGELNRSRAAMRSVPSVSEIGRWIEQARLVEGAVDR